MNVTKGKRRDEQLLRLQVIRAGWVMMY